MQVLSFSKLTLSGALALLGLLVQAASADSTVAPSPGASGGTGPNTSGHTAQDGMPPGDYNLDHTAQDSPKPKPDKFGDPPTFDAPGDQRPSFTDPLADEKEIPGINDALLDLLEPAVPAAPNPLLLTRGEPDLSGFSYGVDPVGPQPLPASMYTTTSSSIPSPGALVVLGLGALTLRRRRRH